MDLRKLEIFVGVATHGSFSAAALSLHMAQPAVSIAVRKLEEALGVTLFDRGSRRVLLTTEGEHLLRQAQTILQQVEDLHASTGEFRDLLRGELDIVCPSMLATYYLPDLLSGFLGEHPGLTASVTQAGTTQARQMLLAGEVEIGVITDAGDAHSHGLELLPLVDEQMVVCVAGDHPWARRQYLRPRELDRLPMVAYASGYFIRARLDQLCVEHEIMPDLRMQSNFLPLLIRMVKQGLGATVGLKVMAEQEPDIVGIPLSPPVPVHMALARRRGRSISGANQAFMDWAALGSHRREPGLGSISP